jgi:hypothetical protein
MEGWKKVLSNFKRKRVLVKVLFIFPNVNGVVIRSGKIIKVESDCFCLDDVKEGINWFSFNWISSVKKMEVVDDAMPKV